jgi:arginyl-tRNA synthetase
VTPNELSELLSALLRRAQATGALSLDPADIPAQVHVERPRQRSHGDWSTNVALQLAKKAGMAPRDFAEVLAGELRQESAIEQAQVAGPGFVNITLRPGAAGELVRQIVESGANWGHGEESSGTTVNVEFVSANPTGPIHLAGARWAAVGDSISRLLEARGAQVVREYYFNDHGSQIDAFAASLLARARGEEPPDNGYGGAYIAEVAAQIVATNPGVLDLPQAQALEVFRADGVEMAFEEIKRSLADFGVHYDVFFHEQSLHESGAVQKALDALIASGAMYNDQGAWWLRTTEHGDDKDRVVIKSDGAPAYIAADIAYFKDKRERGADLAIYLLGADHHGYIARLKAAAAALGDDPERVEVLIGQMVFLVAGGQRQKMSKRAGTVVTMADLVDVVGVDAARYAMSRSSIESTLEIDLELWASQTNENPVYYVQYAHARTANVARKAYAAGVHRADGFDPNTLDHPTEAALIGQLARFDGVVRQAAELREPHRVARYLETLASAYHKWYDARRVVPFIDELVTDVHRSRLWLNDATGQVIANGLGLLGVSAPERM